MLLPDGYHDVPAGSLATVVTYLEMTAVAPARSERTLAPWTLRPVAQPGLDWYRDLYRRVGADWLWSSRLSLTDTALSAVLGSGCTRARSMRRRPAVLRALRFRALRPEGGGLRGPALDQRAAGDGGSARAHGHT